MRFDEVQRLMLVRLEEALAALWPSEMRPPYALMVVQFAVCELLDYTLRTERGRAQMRKRLVERWSGAATRPGGLYGKADDANLAANPIAQAVVPGLLAALEGLPLDLSGEGVAAAVDEWLLGFGDGS